MKTSVRTKGSKNCKLEKTKVLRSNMARKLNFLSMILLKVKIYLMLIVLMIVGQSSIAFSQEPVGHLKLCPESLTGTLPILQGYDGWLFHPGDMLMITEITEENQERMRELSLAFDYLGIKVVFAISPARAMLHPEKVDLNQPYFEEYDYSLAKKTYKESIDSLNDLGFVAPNILDYIRMKNVGQHYTFSRDSHWNINGSLATAKSLKEVIEILPAYQNMQLGEYEVSWRLTQIRESDLVPFVTQKCPDTTILFEYQDVYEIVTDAEQSLEDGLFGETTVSSIPLWGTSYSTTSNFEEFLQSELDVEILNYSVVAGGLWASVLSYFLITEQTEGLPSMAIWELPFQNFYEFNVGFHYSEVIPTVYGVCSEGLMASSIVKSEIPDSLTQNNLLEQASFPKNWAAIRAVIKDLSEKEPIAKLTFNGQDDPWMHYDYQLGTFPLGEELTFSVVLWTDEEQPKSVGLYLYSNYENIKQKTVILTKEPKRYSISHIHTEEQDEIMTLRIDGLEGVWTEDKDSKGQYLYAMLPELRQSTSFKLIDNLQSDVYGTEYYSYLKFDDKSIVEFELVYEYIDGVFIDVNINRSATIVNNGKYFYELPQYNASPLKKIHLRNLKPGATGFVTAQLCKKPNR